MDERDFLTLLPGAYYMDPPDGGSVTVLEQLQRMAKDAERYRWLRSTTNYVTSNGERVDVRDNPELWDRAIDAGIAKAAAAVG